MWLLVVLCYCICNARLLTVGIGHAVFVLQSSDVLEYWDCVWNFYPTHNPLLLEYLSTLLAAESKFTYLLTYLVAYLLAYIYYSRL